MTAAAKVSEAEPTTVIADEEKLSLDEWIEQFGADQPIKVKLVRIRPKSHVYKGRAVECAGTLDEYEEQITEEQIFEEHGGGTFQLKVQLYGPDKNGKVGWHYAKARTFKIAGDPDVRRLLREVEEDEPEDRGNGTWDAGNPVVNQAMEMAYRLQNEAQERAESMRNNGLDTTLIQTLLAPLQAQIEVLMSQVNDGKEKLYEVATKPIDRSHEERLYAVLEGKETSHGNALQQLRDMHASELRQLREYHADELRRRDDRHRDEIKSMQRVHDREIATMEKAHTSALDSQRVGMEARIDSLKDSKKSLERELTEVKTELATLRGKKDLTPVQMLSQVAEMKNAVEGLIPSQADETPKAGWERAIDAVMGSPLIEGIAERVASGGGGAPAGGGVAPGEQMVKIQQPGGRIVEVPASYVARMQAQRAAREAQAQQEAPAAPAEPQIDPDTVSKAVVFIEAAYRNGTAPEIFAASARNMIPSNILEYIKQRGVDHFLNNVAKLDSSSPLSSVLGRTYIRNVAQFLLEGTISSDDAGIEADDDPETPTES